MFSRFYKFYLLFPILLAIAIYFTILDGFFQQDEWLGFARFILLKDTGFLNIISYAFTTFSGHYVPLSLFSVFGIFSVFGLNYTPYALVSILLHIVNIILVFYFCRTFLKNDNLALFSTILFSISSSNYQATAWTVADLSIHAATIFGLLSLICILKFLETDIFKFFLASLLLLVISLLFKEIAVGFFAFIPVLIMVLGKRGVLRYRKHLLIFLIVGLIYIIFRVTSLFSLDRADSPSKLVPQSAKYPVYNFLTVPLKSVSQTAVPIEVLIATSYKIGELLPDSLTGVKNTPIYNIFVEKRILEVVSIITFLIITIGTLSLFKKTENKRLKNIIILNFLFVIFNSFIFAFAPERIGIINIIDSRNLYLSSVGTSILVVLAIYVLLKKDFVKIFILIVVVSAFNIYYLGSKLAALNQMGISRKAILESVKDFYPKLPQKVIFYTESDRSFYGLGENERILPFQSGFGQTLLSWYYQSERFPKELYDNKFLWEITAQGYKEVDKRGFGYFRDFKLLAQTLESVSLSPDVVRGLRYDSQTGMVEDNTEEVKGRLLGFFTPKNNLDLTQALIFSSQNQSNIQLIVDGERETFWDSELPYNNPQDIELDLKVQKKISKIEIDSFTNIDQVEVGYRVLLSKDKKNWQEVFYAKRYPPDKRGLVEIYFNPTLTRFIKIEQVGFHKFASWVVHELKLYEAVD